MWQTFVEYLAKGEHFIAALVFGLVNMLVRPPKNSVFAYLVEYFIAICVGVVAGLICRDLGFQSGTTYLFIAISTLLSRDIINLITGFGTFMEDNQNVLYKKLLAKWLKLDNKENKE